jgi:hypothetical protein
MVVCQLISLKSLFLPYFDNHVCRVLLNVHSIASLENSFPSDLSLPSGLPFKTQAKQKCTELFEQFQFHITKIAPD